MSISDLPRTRREADLFLAHDKFESSLYNSPADVLILNLRRSVEDSQHSNEYGRTIIATETFPRRADDQPSFTNHETSITITGEFPGPHDGYQMSPEFMSTTKLTGSVSDVTRTSRAADLLLANDKFESSLYERPAAVLTGHLRRSADDPRISNDYERTIRASDIHPRFADDQSSSTVHETSTGITGEFPRTDGGYESSSDYINAATVAGELPRSGEDL